MVSFAVLYLFNTISINRLRIGLIPSIFSTTSASTIDMVILSGQKIYMGKILVSVQLTLVLMYVVFILEAY
jgi:hypothetical protein